MIQTPTQTADIPYIPVPPAAVPLEARLQLAAIVDSSDDAIISKDLQGVITTWNAAATRIFGYTADEVIGKSVLVLIPPELQSEEPDILRKVTSGVRIDHYETRRRRKNGDLFDISLTISPIRDKSGRIVGISKIARDITERKQAEAALFESERLATIGRMAASIAHEVNNPLEAILNVSYLLSQNQSLDDEARGYAQLLLNEVVRVSEITKQTLSFYRDVSTSVEINLGILLEDILKLHHSMFEKKSIRVTAKLQPSVLVRARSGELRQVFTNLIINAVDALPRNGKIRISVSRAQHQNAVCVTIADNGPGIPESVRDRIFEPFFTTKPSRGTGLGLWVSQGILRKYGGSIRLHTSSRPGFPTGTVFRVCLPSGL